MVQDKKSILRVSRRDMLQAAKATGVGAALSSMGSVTAASSDDDSDPYKRADHVNQTRMKKRVSCKRVTVKDLPSPSNSPFRNLPVPNPLPPGMASEKEVRRYKRKAARGELKQPPASMIHRIDEK